MKSRRTLRLPAALVAVCCACLALLTQCQSGNQLEVLPPLAREGRREETLDRQAEALRRFNQAKQRIVAEVAAGRMSLVEAAEHFRRLNHDVKELPDPPPGASQLREDDEALSRNLLDRVRVALRADPGRAVAVLDRLRGEFRERFGHSPTPAIRFTGGTLSFTATGVVELKPQGGELIIQGIKLKLQ